MTRTNSGKTMSVGSIKKELARYGLRPRKRFGQHFLIDRSVLDRLIRTAGVEKDDEILEVGAGLGEMTLLLARRVRQVIAVEIDQTLVKILREKVASFPNVSVVEGDVLRMDFGDLPHQKGRKLKVVANLPYQISTPLLFRFIESRGLFSCLTLMLQREVAERMTASPGGKQYGPLSIFIQAVSQVSIQFTVQPRAFFPPPKVESAVVRMIWRERPLVPEEDEEWFRRVVKACFGYRRKKLINGLRYSDLPLPQDIELRIRAIGVDPERRPETLSLEEFKGLAKALRG